MSEQLSAALSTRTRMPDHTPLPWVVGDDNAGAIPIAFRSPIVMTLGGTRYIATGFGNDIFARPNARFIVRAANAHYDLLEACRQANQLLAVLAGEGRRPAPAEFEKTRQALSEALRKAEPEKRVTATADAVSGKRHRDRRCPQCGEYHAMDNPVEHRPEPFLCLACGCCFAAPADSE